MRIACLVVAAVAIVTLPALDLQAEESVDRAAMIVAQALAEAVTARDPDAAAVLCALPANLDGEVVATGDALVERWRRTLERDELRGLSLENLEVLSLTAAVEHHGQPPRRLGELDPSAVVAIIRWNRAQLVAVLAQRDGRWAVIAVTD